MVRFDHDHDPSERSMPELPEVETMRRGILGIVGRRIAAVERPACKRRPIAVAPSWPALRRRLVGRTIERIDRLGKRVVIVSETGDRLVLEPRMTGLVLLSEPPTREHLRLRLVLHASDHRGEPEELLFWDRRGLGTVRLYSPEEFERTFVDDRLGPDALSISPAVLRERLAASTRAIKVALLDQKGVAGIGNLYASEILHLARIHPQRRCRRLNAGDWERLHAMMNEVLLTAIRFEGSTLSDGTYRNALNQSGGYQNQHRVYDRADEPCPGCGQPIRRIVQAQRSTFFCPECQPRSGRK
jgi:formamidopyrimidine-DNA glycosylase